MTAPSTSPAPQSSQASRGTVPLPRCLIVHDDLQLRLKLADLVRRTALRVEADTLSQAAFDNLDVGGLHSYIAVLFVIDFYTATGADPLLLIRRVRQEYPLIAIFVFASGGDERCAARTIKAGATDYWPMHTVELKELGNAIHTSFTPPGASPASTVSPKPGIPLSIPIPISATSAPPFNHTNADPLASTAGQVAGYHVLKKIAQSTTAIVYLARNDELSQPIALKVQPLKSSRHLADAHRQSFARECAILAGLNHPSIANLIDYGITDRYLYLALEYFPCGSLRERLKNPVSESEALDYARQIANALRVVHTAGIVHRDIKPSNLMLRGQNKIALIDFGSARARLMANSDPPKVVTTGTPYYASPEQIDGQDPDQRGDLYSLGIILFEMLAGSHPFQGRDLAELFAAHRSAPVPPLPDKVRHYAGVVNRLLAKHPQDRYADAAQFLEALEAASHTIGKPVPQP